MTGKSFDGFSKEGQVAARRFAALAGVHRARARRDARPRRARIPGPHAREGREILCAAFVSRWPLSLLGRAGGYDECVVEESPRSFMLPMRCFACTTPFEGGVLGSPPDC